MPSLTPNYSWPYPISSDDLNAGATEIGNLANDIDTDLKAEENARIAADNLKADLSYVNAQLATKWGIPATGNVVVTTAFGEFNIGSRTAASTLVMDGDSSVGGGPKFITEGGSFGNFYAQTLSGAAVGNIRVTYLGW